MGVFIKDQKNIKKRDLFSFSELLYNETERINFTADYHTIVYLKKGSGIFVNNFLEYAAKQGDVFVVNPKEEAFLKIKKKNKILFDVVCFNDSMLLCPEAHIKLKELPVLKSYSKKSLFNLSGNEQKYLIRLFEKLKTELDDNNRWQWNMLRICLTEILIFLSRKFIDVNKSAGINSDDLIDKFYILLEKNYTAHSALSFYSENLGIAEITLAKKIKSRSGKTFQAVVNERLAVEAMRKLFNTDKSAKEIAYELGFEDPAYFHRFFKKYTERTPQEFREYALKKYS